MTIKTINAKIAKLQALAAKALEAEAAKHQKKIQEVLTLMKKLGVTAEEVASTKKGKGGRPKGSKNKAAEAAAKPAAKAAKADKPAATKKGAKKAAKKAGKKAKGPKLARPIKYMNAETGDTWIGAGRPPKWITVAEKAGKKREEFLVK